MKLKTALQKVKEKGLRYTIRYILFKLFSKGKDKNAYNIVLLTNRDSDNLGDQVIEACDIGLISTVMKNLNIKESHYMIQSRAAAIIPQKFLSTRDPKHLKNAHKTMKDADIVIFGGAPMFNYLYQTFYEKTAVTLEVAQELGKPVIFSAIGVERYEEDNAKCQRLKKTLNFDCVKQITTRDDFEALQKYCESDHISIGKVADPAVFSDRIFKNYITPKKSGAKKKIGLFILRANGFVDNHFDFDREASAKFWVDLMHDLTEKGYDYELLTSGHFGDEAFIDHLIRNHGVSLDKCVFNMNTPEKIIEKISSYDAIVSCRLHPSIIAFALDVPSVGLVWNNKVRGFYDSVGYSDRVICSDEITSSYVLSKIEQSMEEGIQKDKEYLCTIYNALFYSIQKILCGEDSNIRPYSYDEILKNMPVYTGTSESEKEIKLERKFRRTYNMYNTRFERNMQYLETIKQLKKEIEELKRNTQKEDLK